MPIPSSANNIKAYIPPFPRDSWIPQKFCYLKSVLSVDRLIKHAIQFAARDASKDLARRAESQDLAGIDELMFTLAVIDKVLEINQYNRDHRIRYDDSNRTEHDWRLETDVVIDSACSQAFEVLGQEHALNHPDIEERVLIKCRVALNEFFADPLDGFRRTVPKESRTHFPAESLGRYHPKYLHPNIEDEDEWNNFLVLGPDGIVAPKRWLATYTASHAIGQLSLHDIKSPDGTPPSSSDSDDAEETGTIPSSSPSSQMKSN